MKKILHPGLGKCGTTSKQLYYWPRICKLLNWNFISHGNKEITDLDENVYDWFCNISNRKKNKVNISEFKKTILISDEGLLEGGRLWDPEFYEENIKYISSNFDQSYEIILTLRKPSNWLISNYLQYIIQGGNLKIEEFYLNDYEYKKSTSEIKFNIEKFNYETLILNFKKKFKKVYILFYEFEDYFSYNKIFQEKRIKSIIEKKIIEKKSISYLSYLLLVNLNNFKIFRNNKIIKYLIRKLDKIFFNFFFKFPKNHFLNKINFDIKKLDSNYLKLVAGLGFELRTFRL